MTALRRNPTVFPSTSSICHFGYPLLDRAFTKQHCLFYFSLLLSSFGATVTRLYDSWQWDDKAIRKLIGDGRIAPRLKGAEYRTNESEQECPICFLHYSEVNMTKCCNAYICTECFLQVRPQKEKQSTCPFCNCSKLLVSVAKKPTEDDIQARNQEEQAVIEARIRGANNGIGLQNDVKSISFSDHETTPVKKKSPAAVAPDSPGPSGFGSQLEKDERFQLLKKRSESFASNEGNRTPQADNEIIKAIAMTPEERRRLEAEMRAQLSHPLTLQVEAEAQERILQNERTYQRNNSGGSNTLLASHRAPEMMRHGSGGRRRHRSGAPRDWNRIVDAFERGGNGEVASLDDLVVMEAAILLSMEEEARRSRDGESFDAERHAREGFPLVRSFLSGQVGNSSSLRRGEDLDRMADIGASSPSAATQDQEQSLALSLREGQRRFQAGRASTFGGAARYFRGMGDAALDTASMMMRGISEEEQIAMAIAASLQEQNGNPNTQDSEADDENGTSDSTGNEAEVDVSESLESHVESDDQVAVDIIVNNSSSPDVDAHGLDEVSGNSPQEEEGSHQEFLDVIDVTGESITINELARVVTDSLADESSTSIRRKDESSPVASLSEPDVSSISIPSESGEIGN